MLFIYLYHADLCSDLWKGDLFFRPAAFWAWSTSMHTLFKNDY